MTLRTALFSLALALVMLLPGPAFAVNSGDQERDPAETGDSPGVLDNAKNLTRRQGALSEETIRAAQSGEAKAKPPVGATHGGMAAPTKPSKGGKAIYGDIVVHK